MVIYNGLELLWLSKKKWRKLISYSNIKSKFKIICLINFSSSAFPLSYSPCWCPPGPGKQSRDKTEECGQHHQYQDQACKGVGVDGWDTSCWLLLNTVNHVSFRFGLVAFSTLAVRVSRGHLVIKWLLLVKVWFTNLHAHWVVLRYLTINVIVTRGI